MKSHFSKLAALTLIPALATSCMTTYDAYGNPVQSVDPGVAVAGAAAAALVGAAVANNNDNHYYYGRPYHKPRPPRPYYPPHGHRRH
ncbi:hypothetical protein ACFQY0_14575 [Haloferula chungangensis]|uniref:Lipoprotein n=1 Tax=Haloferula chungangensis TaxID=1048331 RepID=A0ABW2L7P3_9BACT